MSARKCLTTGLDAYIISTCAIKRLLVVFLVVACVSANAEQTLINTPTLSGEVPIKTWKTL